MTPLTLVKLINGTYSLLRNFFWGGMGGGGGGKNGGNGVCESSVTLYQPVV